MNFRLRKERGRARVVTTRIKTQLNGIEFLSYKRLILSLLS